MLFKICLVFDWIVCAAIAVFFLIGLGDGSVSSENAGIWAAILTGLAAVMLGGLKLNRAGRPGWATILLLVLAVPGLLCCVFLLLVLFSGSKWN